MALPTPPGLNGYDVLIERITNLQLDVSEIKKSVNVLDDIQREFQREYLTEHAKVVQEATAAHRRLDEFEKRLEERNKEMDKMRIQMEAIQKAIAPMISAYRMLVFLGSALGLSVLALIWSMITGQVQLVF